MYTMAGFSVTNGESNYYVPRTKIPVPEKWINLLFPKYKLWISQYNSIKGDKGKAAFNFLFHVLPFFAIVIVQDGIYWVTKHPSHEFSLRLLTCIPGYIRWSQRHIHLITVTPNCPMPPGKKCNNMSTYKYSKPNFEQVEAVNMSDIELPLDQPTPVLENLTVILPPNEPTPASENPSVTISPNLCNNLSLILPISLGKSICEIYQHWLSNKLDEFASPKFCKHWNIAYKNRYSVRLYIFNCVGIHANRNTISKSEAVSQMDVNRNQMGLLCSEYVRYLKKNHIYFETKKRKKQDESA